MTRLVEPLVCSGPLAAYALDDDCRRRTVGAAFQQCRDAVHRRPVGFQGCGRRSCSRRREHASNHGWSVRDDRTAPMQVVSGSWAANACTSSSRSRTTRPRDAAVPRVVTPTPPPSPCRRLRSRTSGVTITTYDDGNADCAGHHRRCRWPGRRKLGGFSRSARSRERRHDGILERTAAGLDGRHGLEGVVPRVLDDEQVRFTSLAARIESALRPADRRGGRVEMMLDATQASGSFTGTSAVTMSPCRNGETVTRTRAAKTGSITARAARSRAAHASTWRVPRSPPSAAAP